MLTNSSCHKVYYNNSYNAFVYESVKENKENHLKVSKSQSMVRVPENHLAKPLTEKNIYVNQNNIKLDLKEISGVNHYFSKIYPLKEQILCSSASETKAHNIPEEISEEKNQKYNKDCELMIKDLMKNGSNNDRFEACIKLIDYLKDKGMRPGHQIFTPILHFHLKNENEDKLLETIEIMEKFEVQVNSYPYNLLIKSCYPKNDIEKAFTYFEKMKSKEIKPDIYTYNFLLRLCTQNNEAAKIVEILEDLRSNQVEKNRWTSDIMTDYFVKNQCFQFAKKEFMSRFTMDQFVTEKGIQLSKIYTGTAWICLSLFFENWDKKPFIIDPTQSEEKYYSEEKTIKFKKYLLKKLEQFCPALNCKEIKNHQIHVSIKNRRI